jgi:hypothetical protein
MILTLQQIENLRPRRNAGPDSRVQFRKRQEILRSLVLDIERDNVIIASCAVQCALIAEEGVRAWG